MGVTRHLATCHQIANMHGVDELFILSNCLARLMLSRGIAGEQGAICKSEHNFEEGVSILKGDGVITAR